MSCAPPCPSPLPADPPLLACERRGVPGGHRLQLTQHGTPQGIPVLLLHGGPGSGLSPQRCGFDAVRYRLIGIDPRRAAPIPSPTAAATPPSPCRCA